MFKKVAFYTLGCRVNQYETSAMESILSDAGYKIVPFDTEADVYIVNTCTVTSESERKCRQILRRAKGKNPDAIVAAVGCMAQSSFDLLKQMPEVDIILGTNQKHKILKAIEDVQTKPCYIDEMTRPLDYQELKIYDFKERDRAFVKIQDGCDRFCSYCIIPYVRGRVRSRKTENILDEISLLSEKGFQEVVLTGIHVASFGRGTDTNLSKLIQEVSEIKGIERIRLSSIDPTAFNDTLLETYRNTVKLCPHFHISLQSGSTSVLKRMNRRYTAEEYAEVVSKLREIRPDTCITTDIITGFPGETEEEFLETLDFVDKVALAGIHVFPYSIREGTVAAKMLGQIPKNTKNMRAKILAEKAAQLRNNFASSFVGTTQPVLFEHKDGQPSGFSPHFLRVVLPDCADSPALYGKIKAVKLLECKGEILYGKF